MKNYFPKSLLVTLFLIQIATQTFSQNGSISGKIIDKITGEEIIGAVVKIEGTNTATTTDLSGNYILKVPAGNHTIACNFISYRKILVNNVAIKEGENITLDFALEMDNIETENVGAPLSTHYGVVKIFLVTGVLVARPKPSRIPTPKDAPKPPEAD